MNYRNQHVPWIIGCCAVTPTEAFAIVADAAAANGEMHVMKSLTAIDIYCDAVNAARDADLALMAVMDKVRDERAGNQS